MNCEVFTGILSCAPAYGGQSGGMAGAARDSRYRTDVVFDARSASYMACSWSIPA
jgi:hypothetical protein